MDGGAGRRQDHQHRQHRRARQNRQPTRSAIAVSVSAALGVAVGGEITKASTTAENRGHRHSTQEPAANEIANSGSIGAAAGSAGQGRQHFSRRLPRHRRRRDARRRQVERHGHGRRHQRRSRKAQANRPTSSSNSGAVTATAMSNSQGRRHLRESAGASRLGDTTNTSTAEAAGIRTSEGKDQIQNEKAITAHEQRHRDRGSR